MKQRLVLVDDLAWSLPSRAEGELSSLPSLEGGYVGGVDIRWDKLTSSPVCLACPLTTIRPALGVFLPLDGLASPPILISFIKNDPVNACAALVILSFPSLEARSRLFGPRRGAKSVPTLLQHRSSGALRRW